MSQSFKPLPSAMRCMRQQPFPQSWQLRSKRFLSTSPVYQKDISPEQKRTEDLLFRKLDEDKGSGPANEASPMATLARNTKGSTHPRMSQIQERVLDTVFNRPYEEAAPAHHLHVYAHKRSTIITLTRPNREVMLTQSCGHIGLRHSKRKGYDPAHQLSSHVLAKIQEQGWLHEIKALEVVFRDFGPGREAFTKILLGNEGKNFQPRIVRVTDATRLKFGGTKSPHVRRLG